VETRELAVFDNKDKYAISKNASGRKLGLNLIE
jgi:hypothetical protein